MEAARREGRGVTTTMTALRERPGCLAAVIAAAMLCASVAAAEDAPDALLTTPVTPAILAQGAEADAYAQGVQAYVWGYPLVRMERVARQYTDVPANNPPTSYRAPLNAIGWARELATAASKDMPTSNNDTFYMSAIVDLDRAVHPLGSRYGRPLLRRRRLQHVAGARALYRTPHDRDQSRAISRSCRPAGKASFPAGVTRLDVTTDKIWLWGRLRLTQGEDKCAGAGVAERNFASRR